MQMPTDLALQTGLQLKGGNWRRMRCDRGSPTSRRPSLDGLPTFYRRIDTALSKIGQPHLPLDHNLFTFGSWMGGDRDGNPFVTPEITRDVVISARLTAVNLYFKAIERLMFELSVWRSNDEVKVCPFPMCKLCKEAQTFPSI